MFGLFVRFTCKDEAAAEAYDRLVAETIEAIKTDEPGTLVYASHTVEGQTTTMWIPFPAPLGAPDAPRARTAFRYVAPNPARGPVVVDFMLARSGPVRLTLHDISGRRIKTLAEGPLEGGEHRVPLSWARPDGAELASGVYWVRLHTAEGDVSRRVVRMR